MEQARVRTKNTSFSTDPETFRLAKSFAVLEDISLSELVHRALLRELERLERKHRQNQAITNLLISPEPEKVAAAN